jgi:hypothetical protein
MVFQLSILKIHQLAVNLAREQASHFSAFHKESSLPGYRLIRRG